MAAVGCADIAAMAGFLAQAAVRQTSVVLAGLVNGRALAGQRLAAAADILGGMATLGEENVRDRA